MAFLGFTLTLTGSIQRLSDVYGDGTGVVNVANDLPYRTLTFQALKANTNDVYVGGRNQATTLSSTKHAIRLDPTDTQAVSIMGSYDMGPLKLSDFYVLGTNGEAICVGAVPF